MNRIPLFDSLTHPTPNGEWLDARFNAEVGVDALRRQMESAEVTRVIAVGMGEGVGGYRELEFSAWIRRQIPSAYPVAYCDPVEFAQTKPGLAARMASLRNAGYVGIKLHPRLGNFSFATPELVQAIQAASEAGLFSMLCTYCFGKGFDPDRLALTSLLQLLDKLDNARIVLLHGGLSHVLEWSEAVRPWPNVLLDVSFTMLRFRGSSIDLDLQFLFEHFDQRVCVGSDHPQYTLQALRSHFDVLTDSIAPEKAAKVAYRNLERLIEQR